MAQTDWHHGAQRHQTRYRRLMLVAGRVQGRCDASSHMGHVKPYTFHHDKTNLPGDAPTSHHVSSMIEMRAPTTGTENRMYFVHVTDRCRWVAFFATEIRMVFVLLIGPNDHARRVITGTCT